MKYKLKPVIIEATQWFKNGDHPLDDVYRPFEDTGKLPTEPREGKIVRYFRHPEIPDGSTCPTCGKPMRDHGWLDTNGDGECVCPGDYIVSTDGYFCEMPRVLFETLYDPVDAAPFGLPGTVVESVEIPEPDQHHMCACQRHGKGPEPKLIHRDGPGMTLEHPRITDGGNS